VSTPVHALLDRLQRAAGRSSALVRLAILVRNQARCVIKYHLAEGPDVAETGEVWLRKALASDAQFVVDVGANVGDWMAGMYEAQAGSAFDALLFEPSSSAAARLRERFAGNQHIRVVEAAVGDAPGELPFFEEPNAGKGSSLVPQFNRNPGTMRGVEVTTLDAELARAGWERIDLLKIDAEGYDLRVLRGARGLLEAQRIRVLQFEYNRAWQAAGDTLSAAYSLLQSHGYQVYLLKRDGLYTLNYRLYEEYFEYSNFVAIAPDQMGMLSGQMRGMI